MGWGSCQAESRVPVRAVGFHGDAVGRARLWQLAWLTRDTHAHAHHACLCSCTSQCVLTCREHTWPRLWLPRHTFVERLPRVSHVPRSLCV